MSDDESPRVSPRESPDDRYGEALLYDFAKFMTTTSLIMLGGMLTLSGAAKAGDLKPFNLVLTSGVIALAGMLAFGVASNLAAARAKGAQPSRHLLLNVKASTGLMGMGIGAFLMMWMDTLL